MINSREIIFNSVRNIGFKDGKPADEKLILNHSVRKGENGDLLILIGQITPVNLIYWMEFSGVNISME